MVSAANNKQFRLGFMLFVTLLMAKPAIGLEFTRNFYLPTSVDFDTNIRMASQDKRGITMFTLNPRINIVGSDELNTYTIDTSLLMINTSDDRVMEDRRDPTANLGWTHEFERGQFSLAAAYVKASIRSSEMSRSGLVFPDETSVNRSLSANFNYLLSDKLSLGTSALSNKLEFTGGALSSFSNKDLSFNLTYLYSEKFSPFYRLSFSSFTVDNSGANTNLRNMSVGFNYLASPSLSLMVLGGVNQMEGASNSWVGTASLDYTIDDTASLNASIGRQVLPSGLEGFQKSDSLIFGYVKNISQKDHLGANFSWNINRTLNEFRFMHFSGWYARDLSPDWTLRFVAEQRNLKGGNIDVDGSRIGVSLIYNLLNF